MNPNTREQYHKTLPQYVQLANSKKKDYYSNRISELEKKCNNSDTTAFVKVSDIDGRLRAFYHLSFESQ